MPQPDVKLNIGQGSIDGDGNWTPPQGGGSNAAWTRAKELAAGKTQSDWNPADWTVGSIYGFYYTGMNPEVPSQVGGEIDIP